MDYNLLPYQLYVSTCNPKPLMIRCWCFNAHPCPDQGLICPERQFKPVTFQRCYTLKQVYNCFYFSTRHGWCIIGPGLIPGSSFHVDSQLTGNTNHVHFVHRYFPYKSGFALVSVIRTLLVLIFVMFMYHSSVPDYFVYYHLFLYF